MAQFATHLAFILTANNDAADRFGTPEHARNRALIMADCLSNIRLAAAEDEHDADIQPHHCRCAGCSGAP